MYKTPNEYTSHLFRSYHMYICVTPWQKYIIILSISLSLYIYIYRCFNRYELLISIKWYLCLHILVEWRSKKGWLRKCWILSLILKYVLNRNTIMKNLFSKSLLIEQSWDLSFLMYYYYWIWLYDCCWMKIEDILIESTTAKTRENEW